MQKCTKNSKEPKLPPVGTLFVVTKDRTTHPSMEIAKTGFLCKTTKFTKLGKSTKHFFYTDLDFNFKENEWVYKHGIWNWRADELEEITLIQEDI